MQRTKDKTARRLSIAMLLLAVVALATAPAGASIETWTFTGTLNGNTVSADPIIVDGVPGTTANLTAAGVVAGATFSGTITYDTATPDTLTILGSPDPNVGVYLTGGMNWTLGSLSARTAHANQSFIYSKSVNVTTPPAAPLIFDLIIMSGGQPPSWSGTANNLEVRTVPPDPLIPGDLGTAPTMALALFEGTLVDNSQLIAPPGVILDKGFTIPLQDTSTNQEIILYGALSSITGGGTAPACVSGDTDADTICNDVDLCVANNDITQSDRDTNGIGDACNDAFDTDGDEWEDANDNCPAVFDVTNACASAVPGLSTPGIALLVTALLLMSVFAMARERVRA
jgi:hypothetical protein